MTKLTRRQLLIGSGLAAAGLMSGSRVAAWLLGGEQAHAAANATDWADLAGTIHGRVLLPTAADYPMARLAWNTLYDDVYPQAVLQAADARDVQQAVRFCRDHGLQPTARSGGHSFQGFSSSNGLVIDLAAMNRVALSADHSRVRIGAGAQLLAIYRQLYEQAKVTIPGGTCPTVGISGLTQGGGVGPFIRQYGLTLDRLLSAEIVTADGKLRRISPRQDADLFWAIRGGGGGNFGVVTSFEFATVPVDMPFHTQALTFPWSAAARVFDVFQTWVDRLPLQAHPLLEFATSKQDTNAQPSIYVSLWYRGKKDKSDALVNDFIREVGVSPTSRNVHNQSFFATEYSEYCEGLAPAQCAPITRPPGQLPRVGVSTYSEISRQRWSRPAVDVLIDALEAWQRDPLLQPANVDPGLQVAKVIVEPINGATHAVSPSATAFPYRDGLLVFQFQSRVGPAASADLVAAAQAWVSQLHTRLIPWSTGAEYSNYGNRQLKGWASAYYGSNLSRLRQIKAARDPGNLFRFQQSIRTA